MSQPNRYRTKTSTAVITTGAVLLALAGCTNGEDPDPIPGGTETSAPTTSTTETPEASWRDEYTAKELAAYEEALDSWTTFVAKEAVILEEGKATPEAKALYEKYYPSSQAEYWIWALEGLEQVNAHYEGVATVSWSISPRISENSVDIEQCTDYTTVRSVQNGEVVPGPRKYLRRPVIRTIRMNRIPERGWMIYQSGIPPKKGVRRCDPEVEGAIL